MATPTMLRSPFRLGKRLRIAECACSTTPRVRLSPARTHTRNVHYESRQTFTKDKVGVSVVMDHRRDADENFMDDLLEESKDARGALLPQHEPNLPPEIQAEVDALRLPRSVQLTYLNPLKHRAQHGIPACDLQLRSHHIRNVEFMADFALRAAYYLRLPAAGPVPLPRITERWTVPRANFVFKKSQENFERVTYRRLVQVKDAHPETVQVWLGFLQKYLFHGVGLKANVFEYGALDVAAEMDAAADRAGPAIEKRLELFGTRKDIAEGPRRTPALPKRLFKGVFGASGTMGAEQAGHM